MSTRKLPRYVQQLDGRYNYRRRIPRALKAALGGRGERVLALPVTNVDEAALMAEQLNVEFERELVCARRMMALRRARQVQLTDVPLLAQPYFVSMLSCDDEDRRTMSDER
ncbi:MAG: hypothetical protein IH616_03750 [Gemmatimonadales bacterium]|nr:hypothetical protein [Gemmatimonadales bacterium]